MKNCISILVFALVLSSCSNSEVIEFPTVDLSTDSLTYSTYHGASIAMIDLTTAGTPSPPIYAGDKVTKMHIVGAAQDQYQVTITKEIGTPADEESVEGESCDKIIPDSYENDDNQFCIVLEEEEMIIPETLVLQIQNELNGLGTMTFDEAEACVAGVNTYSLSVNDFFYSADGGGCLVKPQAYLDTISTARALLLEIYQTYFI